MNKWYYVKMVWRNSPSINIRSILYMIPFFIMIFTLIIQNVISPINHFVFLKRSNFIYENNLNKNSTTNEVDNLFLKKDSLLLIKTNDKGEGRTLGTTIYFTSYSNDIKKSYFSEDNFIVMDKKLRQSNDKYDGSLFLSYDTANAIGIRVGESIKIGFYVDAEHGKELKAKNFVIAGLVKPCYLDEKPVKSLEGNISLALVSQEDFDWILELNSVLVKFSNEKLRNESVLICTPKADKTELTVRYIKSLTNVYSVLFSLLFAFIAIVAILTFETNYLRNKHKSNMITLNLMGMSFKDIRSTFRIIITINIISAALLSMVITKYIVLNRILFIYVEIIPLLVVFISFLLIVISMSYYQSMKIKKI